MRTDTRLTENPALGLSRNSPRFMYECDPARTIEIESAEALRRHIEREQSLRHVVVQGLDLTGDQVAAALSEVSAEDAVFLGCTLPSVVEQHVRETGGMIFPAFKGLPFSPYRSSLYTPPELMTGYERGRPAARTETRDARIYEYFRARRRNGRDAPVMDALAFRIHDHAIDDALNDLLHPSDAPDPRVVGVMGGHRLRRDAEMYRTVARVGWRLSRDGFFVATGGGPGAMEAANLGASLATYPERAVGAAVDTLATAPAYEDDAYLDRAFDVRDRYPDRADTLAVPTWFYGHEPSNLFPSHIAKYFANSLREDGLLAIARYGVVYAPGSAGTIQEVFMDAAQNHYETFGPASPMIFLDRSYWTEEAPVYPLVQTLAEGTPYADHLAATDDVEAVAQIVREHAATRAA